MYGFAEGPFYVSYQPTIREPTPNRLSSLPADKKLPPRPRDSFLPKGRCAGRAPAGASQTARCLPFAREGGHEERYGPPVPLAQSLPRCHHPENSPKAAKACTVRPMTRAVADGIPAQPRFPAGRTSHIPNPARRFFADDGHPPRSSSACLWRAKSILGPHMRPRAYP